MKYITVVNVEVSSNTHGGKRTERRRFKAMTATDDKECNNINFGNAANQMLAALQEVGKFSIGAGAGTTVMITEVKCQR